MTISPGEEPTHYFVPVYLRKEPSPDEDGLDVYYFSTNPPWMADDDDAPPLD